MEGVSSTWSSASDEKTAGSSIALRSSQNDNSISAEADTTQQDRYSKQNCHLDRSVPGFPTSLCWQAQFIDATGLHGKSGIAQWSGSRVLKHLFRPRYPQWRDLLFSGHHGNVFRQSEVGNPGERSAEICGFLSRPATTLGAPHLARFSRDVGNTATPTPKLFPGHNFGSKPLSRRQS